MAETKCKAFRLTFKVKATRNVSAEEAVCVYELESKITKKENMAETKSAAFCLTLKVEANEKR